MEIKNGNEEHDRLNREDMRRGKMRYITRRRVITRNKMRKSLKTFVKPSNLINIITKTKINVYFYKGFQPKQIKKLINVEKEVNEQSVN